MQPCEKSADERLSSSQTVKRRSGKKRVGGEGVTS